MKLLIIRHGQTEANLLQIVQGNKFDLSLNENGIKQAQLLGISLESYNIPIFYHSVMKRAAQTAQIAAEHLNAKTIQIQGLQEVCFGDAEGRQSKEALEKYKDIFAIIDNPKHPQQDDVCVPNGETVRQSTQRAIDALQLIKQTATTQIAGVVTHGAVMRNLYKHFFKQEHRFDNCEFFEIEI